MAGLTKDQLIQMGGIPDTGNNVSNLPPPPKGVKGYSISDLRNMGATPDQPKLTFGTAKQALGMANESAWSKFAGGLNQVAQGAGESVMESLKTASDVGNVVGQQTAGRVINAAEGKGFVPGGPSDTLTKAAGGEEAMKEATQPQNSLQQIGKTVGDVAQFFAPEGAEAKLYEGAAAHIEKLPKLLGLGEKAAGILTNTLKTAARSAISAGSTGTVAATETESPQQGVQAAKIGGIAGGIGGALETFGSGLLKSVMKSGFKLAPSQEAKAAQKVNSAADFMAKNKITGGDESKYTKLVSINQDMETALQSSLPKTVSVPKSEIIDSINSSVESLKTEDPAIYSAAKRDAEEAITQLKGTKSNTLTGSVTVQDALKAKRSYGSQAFKTSKYQVKDPRVVSEGSYAVEKAFQDGVENAINNAKGSIKLPENLQSLFGGAKEVSYPDFNKTYSQAITSKNLMGMSRFKNDAHLFGRIFGLWAGRGIASAMGAGPVGEIIGAGMGEAGANVLPKMVRGAEEQFLTKGGKVASGVAKIGLGAEESTQ